MDLQTVQKIIQFLQNTGVVFDKGLAEDEFNILKDKFGIIFPPDLKLFLLTALPVSEYFPNWRKLLNGTDNYLKESLTHPAEGILFDIEKNNFWYPLWGEKPKELSEALKTAKKELAKVPKLVRVYSHRYVPSEPLEAGNPVFSINQTDIIYYGKDLESYFYNEFEEHKEFDFTSIKKISFWSDLEKLNRTVTCI